MALLTYKRAWSREEIRQARLFATQHFRQSSPDAVGCSQDRPITDVMPWFMDDESIWIIALDEDVVVGSYCFRIHPPGDEPHFIRIYSMALDPSYEPDSFYYNMNVAIVELIDWPEDSTWITYMPPGHALDMMSQTVYGKNMEIGEPHKGLVRVIATVPSRDEVAHTEVARIEVG